MTKHQSADWQRLADIPEAEFEAALSVTRPTTAGIIAGWHGKKARRLASLERMAAELRAEGWTVTPPVDAP